MRYLCLLLVIAPVALNATSAGASSLPALPTFTVPKAPVFTVPTRPVVVAAPKPMSASAFFALTKKH